MLTTGLIPPGVHGILDYVLGATLIAAPFVLGFDSDTAATVCVVAGLAELGVAMTTAWSRGIIKLIPPAIHGVIDYIFVIALIAAPFIFVFDNDGTATAFFVIVGAGGLMLVAATRFVPDEPNRTGTART